MKRYIPPVIVVLSLVMAIGVLIGRELYFSGRAMGRPDPAPTAPAKSAILTIHYHARVPYYVESAGDVIGLCVDPVKDALKDAGIPFQWQQTPPMRQLLLLQKHPGNDCMLGWFKTPERKRFARFSHPIYQDRPAIAVMRRDDHRVPAHATLNGVLNDRRLRLLRKNGYSYGEVLDAMIDRARPPQIVTTGDDRTMLKMISLDRADYMFIAEVEAEALIRTGGLPRDGFRYVYFSDMPPGNKRYLMCSNAVARRTLDRINDALEKIARLPE